MTNHVEAVGVPERDQISGLRATEPHGLQGVVGSNPIVSTSRDQGIVPLDARVAAIRPRVHIVVLTNFCP